jgi:hypothetical protein
MSPLGRGKNRKKAPYTEYFSRLSDDDGAALANKLGSHRLRSENDAQIVRLFNGVSGGQGEDSQRNVSWLKHAY